jgi:flagellar basal-body rod protein FlgB
MSINGSVSDQIQARITESSETEKLASGVNNVDIDLEMSELAQNQIRFKYAARMIAGAFTTMRRSISGGGSGA